MNANPVRRATESDAESVAALARRPFAAAWSAAAYAAEAGRDDALFFVVDNGAVRGYAVARVEVGEAHLLDFASAEEGRGIGTALWNAVARGATDRACARLTLEVSATNARAVDFYRHRGARVVGVRPKFYNDGSDAILMDLILR